MLFLFFSIYAAAQYKEPTEGDLRTIEEQEFGVGKGKLKTYGTLDEADKKDEDYQPTLDKKTFATIEAESFPIRLVKKSTSGNVLLFDDVSENKPNPGKILLLKDSSEPIVAIRVLKNYDKNIDETDKRKDTKFAGKIVLNFKDPSIGSEYRALKKLGDRIIDLIKQEEVRQQKKAEDIEKTDEELAKEISPDDEELDRGIPVPKKIENKESPAKAKEKAKEKEKKEVTKAEPLFDKYGNELEAGSDGELPPLLPGDDSLEQTAINEDKPYEPSKHAISFEYASILNVDRDQLPANYSALGLRYNHSVWKNLLFKRKQFVDRVSFELSLFYYSIGSFVYSDDVVTVFPVIFTPRYNVELTDNFMVYLYAGIMKNFATQSDGKEIIDTSVLEGFLPSLGIGLNIKFGPGWAARVDFGTDLFGIGAVLKF